MHRRAVSRWASGAPPDQQRAASPHALAPQGVQKAPLAPPVMRGAPSDLEARTAPAGANWVPRQGEPLAEQRVREAA